MDRNKLIRILWERIPALSLVLLVFIMIALMVAVGSKKKALEERKLQEAQGQRPPVNVVVLKMEPTLIRDVLNLPAMIAPRNRVEVRAEVEGKIKGLPVLEGASVIKGQRLAKIDPRDYEITLTGARAAHEYARKNLVRAESLFGKGIIAERELDEAIANEKSLKARMDSAGLDLERTSITSPLEGILDSLAIKEGLLLSKGHSIGVVIDIDPVKVVAGIPESDVSAVRRLDTFKVTVDALEDATFEGRKLFLSSSPMTQAHLYTLEVLVDNPGHRLLPGMFARMEIIKREIPDGLSVPLYAVITQGERRFVYVEKDGVAKTRDVETGILEGWRILVTKGLEPGDRVVVVGQRSVSEGQEVNVIRSVTDPMELLK